MVFDGVERAAAKGVDLVMADTAGRLHTKYNLMQELKKVRGVMTKNVHRAPHETWLVLGDMGELGADAAALHAEAGRQARAAGVTRLYAVGELARAAVVAFNGPGAAFDSTEDLMTALRGELYGPLHILVKGSRSARMDEVVASLAAGVGVC